MLTGTSSEYVGRRPLPRLVQERAVAFVLGPTGVGKSVVAERFARVPVQGSRTVGEIVVIDPQQIQEALVERIARRRWSDRLLECRALVLDGPTWLRARPAAVAAVVELITARTARGRRTVICQGDDEGTVDALLAALDPSLAAIVGLRFPKGERGRIRFARRVCDELDLPRTAAQGAASLEPWGYEHVISYLQLLALAAHSPPGRR